MGLLTEKDKSCPLPKNEADLLLIGEPIAGPFTFQHIMFLVSIICAAITMAISLFLISKHLHRYTEPRQQRQIIRIIFTPVVFAFLSAMSILNYHAAEYMNPLTELYEAFGLSALFLLFVEYVAPDPNTREVFFSQLENRKPKGTMFKPSKKYDVLPGGSLKWYHGKFRAVFLYVMVDILMTLIQEISQATGDFCATSFSPRFAHVWVLVIKNIFLAMAVTAILQFYGRMRSEPEFTQHKPLVKLLSFKLIVGINFLQQIIFNVLIGTHAIRGSTSVTGLDITFGVPAMLVAFEQVLFAVFFHYAFRSREYHEHYNVITKLNSDSDSIENSTRAHPPRMGMFRAAAHAFNPLDLFAACGRTLVLLVKRVSGGSSGNNPGPAGWSEDSHVHVSGTHLESMRVTQGYETAQYNDTSYHSGSNVALSTPTPALHVSPPQSVTDTNAYAYAPYSELERHAPPRYDGRSHFEGSRPYPGQYQRAE